ncbi:hypothetical protein Ddc_16207 [Ditylenchus destructor]|nr:hypothetical protein Ddc_16207 [Ditylenchus destructor]
MVSNNILLLFCILSSLLIICVANESNDTQPPSENSNKPIPRFRRGCRMSYSEFEEFSQVCLSTAGAVATGGWGALPGYYLGKYYARGVRYGVRRGWWAK